jgi:UDP-N-acetylglucosamine--N-acetylmuramyl-(pentapeptide) pyrophosphoryl-undecaprenol N-acetylglucosamine transferase
VPLVLAMGGGTGALSLNRLVGEAARDLVESAQVLHVTGAGKRVADWHHPRYRVAEFLADGFPDLLAASDVVISRAGMSSLTEIGALGKPAVIIPMPHSHQELNAAFVVKAGAGIVAHEAELTAAKLGEMVKELLDDGARRSQLGERARFLLPGDAADRIAAALVQLSDGRLAGPD